MLRTVPFVYTVKYRVLSDTGEGAADFGASARVRPVVTVTIAKE